MNKIDLKIRPLYGTWDKLKKYLDTRYEFTTEVLSFDKLDKDTFGDILNESYALHSLKRFVNVIISSDMGNYNIADDTNDMDHILYTMKMHPMSKYMEILDELKDIYEKRAEIIRDVNNTKIYTYEDFVDKIEYEDKEFEWYSVEDNVEVKMTVKDVVFYTEDKLTDEDRESILKQKYKEYLMPYGYYGAVHNDLAGMRRLLMKNYEIEKLYTSDTLTQLQLEKGDIDTFTSIPINTNRYKLNGRAYINIKLSKLKENDIVVPNISNYISYVSYMLYTHVIPAKCAMYLRRVDR